MNNDKKNKDFKATNDLQSLSQTLLPLARDILGKNGFVETDIITGWDQIAGKELAQYSFPQKIDFPRGKKNGGCLHLIVPSGAFAIEIQHREKYIIDKINTYFGYQAVASLKIIQNSNLTLSDFQKSSKKSEALAPLLPEEENNIKKLSSEINNPNLKEILIKLGHSIYADNNKKENKK